MTPKEIKNLEADDKTNALVHEQVFGKKIHWTHGFAFTDKTGLLGYNAVPKYSRDIDDAWKVVQEMEKKQLNFELRNLLGDERYACIFSDLNDFEPCIAGGVGYASKIHNYLEDWQWGAKAKSVPLAICRAALLYIMTRHKNLLKNEGFSSSEGKDIPEKWKS